MNSAATFATRRGRLPNVCDVDEPKPNYSECVSDELDSLTRGIRFQDVLEPFEIDRARACLRAIVIALGHGFPVTQIPTYVIETAMSMRDDLGDIARTIELITAYCALDYLEAKSFVTNAMFEYLCRFAQDCDESEIVGAALEALVLVTSPQKAETMERLKVYEEPVKEIGLMRLDEGRRTNKRYVENALALLGNVFVSWDVSSEVVCAICGCVDEGECVAWRVRAMAVLREMSYWKPRDFVEFVDDGMIRRLQLAVFSENEMLAMHAFAVLENILFTEKGLAVSLTVNGFLEFVFPDAWSDCVFSEYCKAVATLLRQVNDCHEPEVSAAVKENGGYLLTVACTRWESGEFELKTVAVNLICQVILYGDMDLIRAAEIPFIDIVCETLSTAEYPLARTIISALDMLTKLGAHANSLVSAAVRQDLPMIIRQTISTMESETDLEELAAPLMEFLQASL